MEAKPSTDPTVTDIVLEREKLQLERERLSLERDRLQSERDAWRNEMDVRQRASKRMITPVNLILAMLASLLVGALLGIGGASHHQRSRAAAWRESFGATNGISPGELLRDGGIPGYIVILD
ncbi:MAG: hypothetical protein ACOX5G_13755 [Kiritimatiellia bacterium]|jgi:hypothetical protein